MIFIAKWNGHYMATIVLSKWKTHKTILFHTLELNLPPNHSLPFGMLKCLLSLLYTSKAMQLYHSLVVGIVDMLCKHILSWNPFLSNLSIAKWYGCKVTHYMTTSLSNCSPIVRVVVVNWELWVIKQIGISIQAILCLDFSIPKSQ